LEREKTARAERTKAERRARSERGRFQLPITRDAFEEYRAEQEEAEEKRKREQVEAEKAENNMAAENAKRLKTDMEDFKKYCRDGNRDGSRLYESRFKKLFHKKRQSTRESGAFRDKVNEELEKSFPGSRAKITQKDVKKWDAFKKKESKELVRSIVESEIEQKEIAAIYYAPKVIARSSPYYNPEGKVYNEEQFWVKKLIWGGKHTVVKKLYTVNWINYVFDPKFVGLVKQQPRHWFDVPLGDCCQEEAPRDLQTTIPIRFRQGLRKLCLPNSAASALYYVRERAAATAIASQTEEFEGTPGNESLVSLRKRLDEMAPGGVPCQWFNRKRKGKTVQPMTLDTILLGFPNPVVVIPIGSDGSVSHAVTIVDNLVFDSTQTHALKLCKDTFDWICGKGVRVESIGTCLSIWPTHWQLRRVKACM
jgi:hypothetical protein